MFGGFIINIALVKLSANIPYITVFAGNAGNGKGLCTGLGLGIGIGIGFELEDIEEVTGLGEDLHLFT